MDTQELSSRYLVLIKKNWLPLALGILGVIFFVYGLIGLFSADKAGSDDIIFESSAGQNAQKETIIVDIEGAVVRPGVYKLPQDSRIQDGLIAAGGLSAEADRGYISKTLNLATQLADGTKVYIPRVSEAVSGVLTSDGSLQGAAVNGLININTSSESELDTLPGVGPVTAQKIIAGRPYSSINELLDRKIVNSRVFDQIKEKVTLY